MRQRYSEIDEAIKYIREHIYEPLPLDQLAKHVGYSPYHFSRIFKGQTGLSPLYYVSSMRLQKAKELLLNTHLSVRDIGLEIGQQSLGTFTTRFTEKVGQTPSQFRDSSIEAHTHLRSLQQLHDWSLATTTSFTPPYSTVQGSIQSELPFEGFILIGLFTKPIPEGFPLYGTLLSSLGEFCLTGVKPGTYYLMATSVSWEMKTNDVLLPYSTLRARLQKPIIIQSHRFVADLQLTLHPPKLDDPPILISLPLLMDSFLTRVQDLPSR